MAEDQPPLVDLDVLATAYRHRPPSDASLARASVAGDDLAPGSLILDVGGGPGYHAAVWARQGHRPVVLDPAAAVTGPAARRAVPVVRGLSQAMPFRDGPFDLVWFHLSLHYGDWRRALDEALRVARFDARIEIWTLADDHHDSSMLARWFPSVPTLDARRFPVVAHVEALLADSGASVTRARAVEERSRTVGDWAAAVAAGFVSTLQLVDEGEFTAGIAAFREAHPDSDEVLSYELKLDQLVARR
jgi:SAM-dependent methyltransferase